MRLTVLSRASDLAIVQARLVARAIAERAPHVEVVLSTRPAAGDRDTAAPLASATDKGLFTADLSSALVSGEADLVVHSWKDLPLETRADTYVAGTLARADPRDVLLVRRGVVATAPGSLSVLTSSPRRASQIAQDLPPLLPWAAARITCAPVRGNVPTRLRKLTAGDGDALVVAKAALDRLLSADAPAAVRAGMRAMLDDCRWMVLPIREFPSAPAQGALGIEIARGRPDIAALIAAIHHAPTAAAVEEERRVLDAHGGGCHAAFGVTVLARPYGHVRSVRGTLPSGLTLSEWTLRSEQPDITRTSLDVIWPRPEERSRVTRHPLHVTVPQTSGLWVTRAEALPASAAVAASTVIWVAGSKTWSRLAARGIWVHGSAEGLGDLEAPDVDLLSGRVIEWLRLTHRDSDAPHALATYEVDAPLPADLSARRHFFWTSGALFRRALAEHPAIREGSHASGPGRTARIVAEALGPAGRVSIWLDYDSWLRQVTR